MPITIESTDGGLGFVFTGSDPVSDTDFLEVFSRHLTRDPEAFRKHRYALLDWTGVSKVDITPQAIKQVTSLCLTASEGNPDILVAEVAEQDLAFGLVRMGQILREGTGWENMPFRNRADAENWIRKRARERFGIDGLTFS